LLELFLQFGISPFGKYSVQTCMSAIDVSQDAQLQGFKTHCKFTSFGLGFSNRTLILMKLFG